MTRFGAWVNPGGGWSEQGVLDYEGKTGAKLSVDQHYSGFADAWPFAAERWDAQNARRPLITWEPRTVTLSDIANGKADSYIHARAAAARDLAAPIDVRFAHEMNGSWYPWGKQPAAYIAAWRHIRRIFTNTGATQVRFVWCPNISQGSQDSYYPGDAYVDVIACDGYCWPNRWQSFAMIFGGFYTHYAAKGKPMQVSETACSEQGGDKAGWIQGMHQTLLAQPAWESILWWHSTGKTGIDWRVDTSPAALAAYKAMVTDARLVG